MGQTPEPSPPDQGIRAALKEYFETPAGQELLRGRALSAAQDDPHALLHAYFQTEEGRVTLREAIREAFPQPSRICTNEEIAFLTKRPKPGRPKGKPRSPATDKDPKPKG